MRSVLTSCPFCACGCGLYVNARDGVPVGVAASQHHPVSQGRLCARGWSTHAAAAWGPRLKRPQVRRDGALHDVDWSEALDEAARRLDDLKRRDLPVGVIASPRLTNEESYLAVRLARGALASPHIDAPQRADLAEVLAGIAEVTGMAGSVGTLEDVETSDAILLVEGDLASSHPRAASAVTRAVAAGAKLVSCGQLPTQMARLSGLAFELRFGAEADALAPLVAAALEAGGLGRGRRQPPPGIEELRASLADVEIGEEEREAARWLTEAKRPSVIMAPFAATPAAARRVALAVADLAAAVGIPGRAGAALLVLPTRSNARGSLDMGVVPDALPGLGRLDDAELRARLAAAWGGRVAAERGAPALQMIDRMPGLVIVGDALAGGVAKLAAPVDAAAASRVVVVLDAFASTLLEVADIVLPVATAVESSGTITSAEGRVQRVRRCVASPGEARDACWVLSELARRLGLSGGPVSPDEVLDEITAVVPGYGSADREALDRGWGSLLAPAPVERAMLRPFGPPVPPVDGRIVALDGVYDWGRDPLVEHAPILCRDERSRRKLFPRGQVAMAPADADALGVRQGWLVKLISDHGEAVVPVVLRRELAPGRLSVPVAFRDCLTGVLGGLPAATVRVERV